MLCLVGQSCLTLVTPWTIACQASLSMGILQVRILEWVAMPFSRGSSQPRDQTQVSHIAGRILLSEPPGKSVNTGMGSLSLHRWIFLTQELNWGLLHCRWILYQLSYQGSSHLGQQETSFLFLQTSFLPSTVSVCSYSVSAKHNTTALLSSRQQHKGKRFIFSHFCL